jgi:hypothetical protein
MQRARAIPVAWLGSGPCQTWPKGWILLLILLLLLIIIIISKVRVFCICTWQCRDSLVTTLVCQANSACLILALSSYIFISTLIYVALKFCIVMSYARSAIRDLVMFCKHTTVYNTLLIQAWRWLSVRAETCSLVCKKSAFLTKRYTHSCVWPCILHIHFYFFFLHISTNWF